MLFYHQTLPNHDSLVAAIRDRPALRGMVIHQVELPLVTDADIQRAMKAAIDKYDADIYYTYTPIAFRLLKGLNSKKKPVVFLSVRDLREMAFADKDGKRLPDLNHVTGLLFHTPSHAKHLETLVGAFPKTRRIGVLVDESFNPAPVEDALRDVKGVVPVFVRTLRSETVNSVVARIAAAKADAWYFPQTAYLQDNYRALIPKLREMRLRGLYGWHFGSQTGGTLSMQPTIPDREKRIVEQIELILAGTPPSQIAVETATVLRLSGNMEALRELGDGFDARTLRYIDIFF